MFTKKITFTDYNGVERTEEFLFNLSKAEIMKLEMKTTGGLTNAINEIIAKQDVPKILEMFEEILAASYGEKSADGRRFVKVDENGKPLFEAFKDTEAYSEFFMELVSDAEAANAFMEGIIPADALAAAKAQQASLEAKN